MEIKFNVPTVLVIGALFATFATAQVSNTNAVTTLKKASPSTGWTTDSAIVADVDCDGKPDTLIFGSEAETVVIGIVPGSRSRKPQVIKFPRSSHTQDGFCAAPVRIETSPLECDSSVGPLRGCKPIKSCRAFAVADDECDPFNFYWDSSSKTFRWWRN